MTISLASSASTSSVSVSSAGCSSTSSAVSISAPSVLAHADVPKELLEPALEFKFRSEEWRNFEKGLKVRMFFVF
jgi:hypothetical protein